jgi:glycosyltransferase involved in cell wall biosynthesis
LLPFRFSGGGRDRFLALLGAAEGLVRGTGSRLRSRGRGFDRAAWDNLTSALRFEQRARGGPAPYPANKGPVVCLGALPWAFRSQRPQQLAAAIAREGHPVLYVESFRRSRFQPAQQAWRPGPEPLLVLKLRLTGRPDPFRDSLPGGDAAELAARIAGGLATRPTFVLVQLPFWTDVALELRALFDCPVVYDRIDLHTGFPGVPGSVGDVEKRLLAEADLVTASSANLLARSSGLARRVELLHNAAAVEQFAGPARRGSRGSRNFRDFRDLGTRPRIGYVGALSDWFDTEALRLAAEAMPEADFELAGRVESSEVGSLTRLGNVRLLGEIPQPTVSDFLHSVDLALVPFRDNDLTRAADPVKIYEALAAGLPVVARHLPETARWAEPAVYTYARPSELPGAIRRALDEDSTERAGARRTLVAGESWAARACALLAVVAGMPVARFESARPSVEA